MIIKVCGMREPENIRQVEEAGAQWMGFIFYPRSPRFVDRLPEYLPERALRVGVFVNASTEEIQQKVKEFNLNLVQLHGKETPDDCRKLAEAFGGSEKEGNAEKAEEVQGNIPKLMKAFSIATANDFEKTEVYEGVCDYFLFDTACPGYGGSGKQFDWSLLDHYKGHTPFLLSGGIKPQHLEALKALHHPRWAGIDLNSGFETAPALKDAEMLKEFIEKVS